MMKRILPPILAAIFFASMLASAEPTSMDDTGEASSTWEKLQPVRKLWRNREYEAAQSKLAHIARVNKMTGIGIDVASLKELLTEVKGIVDEGYSSLKIKEGRIYPVPLKEGGSLEGKVIKVNDETIVLEYNEGTQSIALDQIDIERIIRLSVLEYSPDSPENQALFAALYTMEGELDKAQKALKRAAKGGYDAQEENRFVKWVKSAKEAQQRDKTRKMTEEKRKNTETESVSSKDNKKTIKQIHKGEKDIVVLVDRIHGKNVPKLIRRKLENHNVKVKYATGDNYNEKTLEQTSVVLIKDKAAGPISKSDARALAQFVRDGGGLVYFGSTGKADPSLEPFMKALNIKILTDELRVKANTPDNIPKSRAVAGPIGKHPITRNAGPVFFPLRTCTIDTSRDKAFLITSNHVKSQISDESPLIMGATFTLGGGKIVTFGTIPHLYDRKTKQSARRIVLNAIAWANR